MYYHADYDELLEDSLIEELEWLKEEFEFLFKSEKYCSTEKDKQLANQIIENILKKLDFSGDNRINELLIKTLETLHFNFPDLF